jgi:phosphoribosylformylglycinamidine synthase
MPAPYRDEPALPECTDLAATLLALLAQPDIRSKEAVIRRYDHEIRGATVVRPLVGEHHDGHADGVVLARPTDTYGVALGIGVNPWYGVTDPERMAHAVIDEAIRNVVAVGADPQRVSLLDNFSWGDPRRQTTLGALVAAVAGCCAAAHAHSAPFVSGKDSLNNEYLGSDGQRHAVPPTLVITALAHVPDAGRTITPDLKAPGDVLLLVGATAPEFAGSHFTLVNGTPSPAVVPAPDAQAPARYRRLHAAMNRGLVRSCHDLSEGGLAVALAEMAIAGDLGATITHLPHPHPTTAWFAESTGRLLVEVAAADVDAFVTAMEGDAATLGTVQAAPTLVIDGVELTLADLRQAWKGGR